MLYKREEAFRFQFKVPIHGSFKMIYIDGVSSDSQIGTADIIDISPNGLKFKSQFDLSIERKQYILEVAFILNDKLLKIAGKPLWKKAMGSYFIYGFKGLDEEGTKKEIINELKEYSRKITR